jgi:protein-tyrosine phosphatase
VQDHFVVGQYKMLITSLTDFPYKGSKEYTQMALDYKDGSQRALLTPDFGVYLDAGWKNRLEVPKPELKDEPKSPLKPQAPNVELHGDLPVAFEGLTDLYAEYEQRLAEYELRKEAYELDKKAFEELKEELKNQPNTYKWPFAWVEWPDRGTIAVELAESVVRAIVKGLEAGKTIDVGCAGAHGRTGTLLAFLLIYVEHLDPKEAIEQVHKRHCSKAIESSAQVHAIYGFAGQTVTSEEATKLARW